VFSGQNLFGGERNCRADPLRFRAFSHRMKRRKLRSTKRPRSTQPPCWPLFKTSRTRSMQSTRMHRPRSARHPEKRTARWGGYVEGTTGSGSRPGQNDGRGQKEL